MIEPWQVWLADVGQDENLEHRFVVVISSEMHLRSQQGRYVLVAPITQQDRNLSNRVEIIREGKPPNFVMTEQTNFISTNRFLHEAAWQLTDAEIAQTRRMLRIMVDL